MFNQLKESITKTIKSRAFLLVVIFIVLFILLIQRIFYLQIVKGEEYDTQFTKQILKTREINATRGKIYDRNGQLLAYNELAYSVTIEDNGNYETNKEKNEALNEIIYELVHIIEDNGDSIINDFGITLNENDEFVYTTEEGSTARYRFLADIYGEAKIDKLSEEQKNITAEKLMTHLCEGAKSSYGIDQEVYTKAEQLKMVTIRYAMFLNRFSKYLTTKVASDISDETRMVIMENMDKLQGVDVIEDSLRRYVDSEYFASILGYTGVISQDEYDEYTAADLDYDLTDIIGKSGVEQKMDIYLQGQKGEEKVYVDNVGKVVKTAERTEPSAGDDLYLTIDKDLQEAVYKIIEQKLAGILYSKIENIKIYNATGSASDIKIPIDDVYFALFNNEIIDINHFTAADAGGTEQAIQGKFMQKQAGVLEGVRAYLTQDAPAPYKDLSEEDQIYMSYIVNNALKSAGILTNERIDEGDEVYNAWKNDETLSLKDFLNHAINMNWVDSSKLDVDVKYTDSVEIYNALVEKIIQLLQNDVKFSKNFFKYMIRDNNVSGLEVCMLLYEQGVLEHNEEQVAALSSGRKSAYAFMKEQIQTLAITPAQLALEPCTGSAVITDVKSGEVLACVSYPGYDNNRLANSMDIAYFNKLNDDLSKPFYNNATQEKTAPGSTFKMVTAVAGLEESIVSTGTTIVDKGVFEEVTTNPRCWIYPHNHGAVNVVGAIEHSCNYYFYDVGYKMSIGANGNYSSSLGLERLSKYARLFGLGETSGIEIDENSPQISDQDSVLSSIGQGNHNYTTAQLARYVTTIANSGTCYNLSLYDKVTTTQGAVVEDFTSDILQQVEIASSSWNAVHQGMYDVVHKENTKLFGDLTVDIAGKTGTAQQSKTHPNHALFVGYAPYNDPDIAFAIRIANGYTSANSAAIGKDIVRYRYNLADREQIVSGTAGEETQSIND